jgi:ribosome-associated protein
MKDLLEKNRVQTQAILELATEALEDMKARDVRVMDVGQLTSITDYMIIASGTSDRHVRSIASRLVDRAKEAGYPALGVEGSDGGEWVLVDLQDVVVHIMQPRVRDFYKLEKLWDMGASAADPDSKAGAGA